MTNSLKYSILAGAIFASFAVPCLAGPPINRDALRQAVAEIESSNGKNIGPRYEPGFYKRYGKKGLMPMLIAKYGKKPASSSYGKYQIMLVVAWEHKFELDPADLAEESNNTKVYNAIAEKIIAKVGDDEMNVVKFGQHYNGSREYGNKLVAMYEKIKEKSGE